MNRVCIEKSTGKLIEMQSGGYEDEKLRDARLDTLKQNALNAGYKEEDIEVKFVTEEEYEALMEANKPELTKEELYEVAIKAKEAEILRRQAIAEIEAEKIEAEK